MCGRAGEEGAAAGQQRGDPNYAASLPILTLEFRILCALSAKYGNSTNELYKRKVAAVRSYGTGKGRQCVPPDHNALVENTVVTHARPPTRPHIRTTTISRLGTHSN